MTLKGFQKSLKLHARPIVVILQVEMVLGAHVIDGAWVNALCLGLQGQLSFEFFQVDGFVQSQDGPPRQAQSDVVHDQALDPEF